MAMKPPYCEVHGLVCTDVIQSVQVDGAELKTSPQTLAGRRYGDILEQGRNSRKITLSARFLTEDDLDTWIGHINSAPEDFEAYPFRSDRCCYVKKAYATVTDPEVANINGDWTTFHRAKAYLYTREPWMYGANKGARYDSPLSLPVTVSDIKHEGTVDDLAGIDKLSAVGYYNPMPTAATLISVAGDGTVFVVYNDGSIRSFGKDKPSVSLSSPNYPPVSIFAKSSNLLYAVCSDGELRYWEDGTWYLWPATTNAKKVAVGLDGTAAIIGSDDALYVWSGGSWIGKGGACSEIICVSASEIYVIGTDDHFWRYNGSAWADLEGTTAISKIALAQDATHGIYALRASDGLILKWTGDTEGWADWWHDVFGLPGLSYASDISVRNVSEIWVIGLGDDLVYVSGSNGWQDYNLFYCRNLSLTVGSQSVLLCRALLANDLFEVDRFGNIEHSYENDFDCTVEKLSHDLHGGSMVNAHCAISDGKLTVAGFAQCMLPFYGPIPISGEKPYIDVDITAIGMYPPKLITYGSGNSITELDTSLLHVGKNRIYIPGFEGKEDLYVGFVPRLCWVSADNLNGPIWDAVGDGDAAGAIIIGGEYMMTPYGAETHFFNGSNWLEGNVNLNTGRHAAAGGGSSADAIVMGGKVSGNDNSQSTEEFNGTAWAAGGNLLIGRHWHGGGGGSASAFVAGGDAGYVMTSGQTEEYNGTSWVSNGNLSRLRESLHGGGSGTSAMVCGGSDEGILCSNHDVSAGAAWSLVGGLLTARDHHVAAGDYDMGFACSGWAGSPELGSTEEHDGFAWSQGGQMLTPRARAMGGASWLNTVLQSGFAAGGVHHLGRYVYHDYSTELYGRYCSITIDWLKAVVKRCINPEILPKVSPGDVFDLQVACAGGNALTSLEIYFRDAWWF